MKKLILMGALLGATYAQAQNWISYSSGQSSQDADNEQTITQVDAASMRLRDGYRQAWWRDSYLPGKKNISPGKTVGSSVYLYMFDCKNRELSLLDTASYSQMFGAGLPDTYLRSSFTRPAAIANMKAAIPGSHGDGMLQFVCAYALKQFTK